MLRNVLFLLLVFLFPFTVFCQNEPYKHPSVLETHVFLNDFKSTSFFGKLPQMEAGLGMSYIKGINRMLDWKVQLEGSFPDSVLKHANNSKEKLLLLEGDVSVRGRLLVVGPHVQPYLFLGTGISWYHNKLSLLMPVGLGIEFSYKDVFITANTGYKPSFTQSINHRYYYSLGIAGIVGKAKKKRVVAVSSYLPVTLKDRDHDGIADTADACPDMAGVAVFNGCPDKDGDGIMDKVDKCPEVFGVVKYEGCPIPDSDKDGINDDEDQCPLVPGVVNYKGCPAPDKDGDGVNDEEDECVEITGAPENCGCPLKEELADQLHRAAQNIFFETGSYKLLPASYPSLDEVVHLLKDGPSVKLVIEGHTDNNGSEEKNQLLSEKRAKAVVAYLHEKGVEVLRLQPIGYGQLRPIANNTTKEGRAKNRRVELKLLYE